MAAVKVQQAVPVTASDVFEGTSRRFKYVYGIYCRMQTVPYRSRHPWYIRTKYIYSETYGVHVVLVVASHRLLKSATYNDTNRGELKLKAGARQCYTFLQKLCYQCYQCDIAELLGYKPYRGIEVCIWNQPT